MFKFQGWQALPADAHRQIVYIPEVAMDPECRNRLRQDSAFFFLTRIRSQ